MSNQKKALWLLAEEKSIGGAETRLIKIASKLAELNQFKTINIVVTAHLYRSYLNHHSLKHIINVPTVKFIIKKDHISIFTRGLSFLLKRLNLSFFFIDRHIINKKSWLSFLRKNIQEGDIIHCYVGDNARNGAFLFSLTNDNTVIIEITNHRYIDRVEKHLKKLSHNSQKHKACYIQSVSKNVHNNFQNRFDREWFKKRNIHIDFYSGPFIEIKQRKKNVDKENIIIFPHRFVKPKNGILFSLAVKELLEENKLYGWKVYFRGKGQDEKDIKTNLSSWIKKGQVSIGYSKDLFFELLKAKISVSLIETGSYPSQSVFESMHAQCALLISKSGNSMTEFNNESIFFTDLDKDSIKSSLCEIINLNDYDLEKIQNNMAEYFDWYISNKNQYNDILNLYNLNNSK